MGNHKTTKEAIDEFYKAKRVFAQAFYEEVITPILEVVEDVLVIIIDLFTKIINFFHIRRA
jgi:hypothetical protein